MKHKTSIQAWTLHTPPRCYHVLLSLIVAYPPAVWLLGLQYKSSLDNQVIVSSSHFTATCAVKTAIVQYCSGFMCFCCYAVISGAIGLIPRPPQDLFLVLAV